MKNNLKEITTFTLIILYFIYIFTNLTYISNKTIESFNIWLTKIVPILFPTFILIDYLKYNKVLYYLSSKYHFPYYYIISILFGTPSNTYLLKDIQTNYLPYLSTSIYPSLVFTYTNLITIISKKESLIIILSNILSNTLLTIYLKTPPFPVIPYNFSNSFLTSIKSSLNTLINILGTIIFFNTLPLTLISNSYLKSILLSILEITTSFHNLSLINLPYYFKILCIIISLSTCGLCINCQVNSILNNYNKKEYLKIRSIHFFLFLIISSIFLYIFNH